MGRFFCVFGAALASLFVSNAQAAGSATGKMNPWSFRARGEVQCEESTKLCVFVADAGSVDQARYELVNPKDSKPLWIPDLNKLTVVASGLVVPAADSNTLLAFGLTPDLPSPHSWAVEGARK